MIDYLLFKPSIVVHAHNLSTRETEEGGSWDEIQPELQNEFKANLSNVCNKILPEINKQTNKN
jgi:hypothetical protein